MAIIYLLRPQNVPLSLVEWKILHEWIEVIVIPFQFEDVDDVVGAEPSEAVREDEEPAEAACEAAGGAPGPLPNAGISAAGRRRLC